VNRFEGNRKAVLGILYSFIGLALLVASFFSVKIVRDEANKGYERTLILREHRVSSDLSKPPPANLLLVADGLENKPYRLRTDESGFIMPSAIHEKPDASIVFLGGSTTECQFMDEELRFPYLVGRSLEAQLGKRINAYNSGRAGNNTLHSNLLFQGKVIPMRPRIAVLMEGINDLAFLAVFKDYWSPSATRGIIQNKEYNVFKRWIIEHMHGHTPVEEITNDEFSGTRGTPATNLTPEMVSSKYRKNIELFVYLCRQHNITPVLMTQFNRYTASPDDNVLRQMQGWGVDYTAWRQAYEAMQDTLRAVAVEHKVALIDLERLVPKTREYMYDGVHLNANGAALVAALVAERLPEILRRDGGLR